MTQITRFLNEYFHSENFELIPINNSASDRKYFRVKWNADNYILTFSENIKENQTFVYFSQVFKDKGISVPKILKINNTYTLYLQEDLGNEDLLSILLNNGESSEVETLYKKSISELIKIQFDVSPEINHSQCYDFQKLDKNLILNDLNYFKFYFFQPLEIPYSNSLLLEEFSAISEKIESMKPQGFVYRDFQARNIMIKNSQPYFIDYQGGMFGNTVYDLVSLLWQAKAQLSTELKEKLKKYYFSEIISKTNTTESELEKAYQYCLIIRLLQVLGAYGFRGILQRKQHFIESIYSGIKNLHFLTEENPVLPKYPELFRIVKILQAPDTAKKINKLLLNE